jgi:hypothetical protein
MQLPRLARLINSELECKLPSSFSRKLKTPTNPRLTQFTPLIMAAPQAYPPGGTFLDTLKKSFTDVPMDKGSDNAIATTEFLEAAESLTTLFGTIPA